MTRRADRPDRDVEPLPLSAVFAILTVSAGGAFGLFWLAGRLFTTGHWITGTLAIAGCWLALAVAFAQIWDLYKRGQS